MFDGALQLGVEEVLAEGGVVVDLAEAAEVVGDGVLRDVAEVRDLLTGVSEVAEGLTRSRRMAVGCGGTRGSAGKG